MKSIHFQSDSGGGVFISTNLRDFDDPRLIIEGDGEIAELNLADAKGLRDEINKFINQVEGVQSNG